MGRLKALLQRTIFYQFYLQLVKRYRFRVQDKQYPRIYRRYAKRPVDPHKVLFLEIHHPALSNSFRQVYAALAQDGSFRLRCHYLLHTSTPPRRQRKVFRRFLKDLATARALFLDEGTDLLSHVPVRKETAVIQLWHGCGAFKKFGLSVADRKFGADADYMKDHPFHSHYSLVTVSSPEVVWAYAEAMGYPEGSGVIRPTGVSRTDVFFDEMFLRSAKEHLLAAVPQAKGRRVLLYAPTFRGNIREAAAPTVLDIASLQAAVGEGSVLLIKHHPHVRHRPPVPESCRTFAFDVTDSLTIEDLLCVSDVCISDYSSLVFEYSLFERPMVFLADDLDDYFDWRGFYYDYRELAPGPVVQTTAELIDVLTHPDTHFDVARVRAFKEKFMSACDGHATARILDDIGLIKTEPDRA
ncbi:MAG: CDP-glycerol glycerophosphotransferase family protein [Clostridia bacterium]|nr:CDP-glycerol glycerophosphotransferase family protein [Clostridia bacterium]